MMRFKTLWFCPDAMPGHRVQDPRLSEPLVERLFDVFRRELLHRPGKLQGTIMIPQCTPAWLFWLPTGFTAGAVVLSHETRIQAASVLLSGLDDLEDEQAVARVSGIAELPLPPDVFAEITQAQRPTLATLCRDPNVLRDKCITTASVAMATALFLSLGIVYYQPSDLAT